MADAASRSTLELGSEAPVVLSTEYVEQKINAVGTLHAADGGRA
ncbi:MAG: hypothetical protein ACYTGH_16620 [Planctomycetota bacterium]|jgi:hypothetical protein